MIRPFKLIKRSTLLTLLTVIVIGGFVAYGAYVDRTVYTTEQLVIIPGTVTSDSWLGMESVLVQDISEYSLYQDFNERNSAYISELGLFSSQGSVDAPTTDNPNEVSVGTTSTTTESNEETPENTQSTDNNGENTDTQSDTTSSNPTPTETENTLTPEPAPEPEPQATPEASTEPISSNSIKPVVTWGVFAQADTKYRLAQAIVTEDTTAAEPEEAPVPEVSNEPTPSETESVPETTTDNNGEEVEADLAVDDIDFPTDDNADSRDTAVDSEITATDDSSQEPVPAPEVLVPTEDTSNDYVMAPCLPESGCATHSMFFSDFLMPDFESGSVLDSVQLRLSLAAQTKNNRGDGPQRFLVEYTYDTSSSAPAWIMASVLDIDDEISNSINGGYFLLSLLAPQTAGELANLRIKISYQGNVHDLKTAYVEGMWLEVTSGKFFEEGAGEPYSDALTYGRDLLAPELNTLNNAELDPTLGTLPQFTLSYDPQQGFLNRIFKFLFSENTFAVERITLTDSNGQVAPVPFAIEYRDDTTWTMKAEQLPQKLRPGKYQVTVDILENDVRYTDTFEFYWGVLAVNTKKSMYFPNEEVTLNLAALTDKGDTICDAHLQLKIIDPKNNIFEVPVEQSGACGRNNVTDIPDYLAHFAQTGEWGVYTMQLQHLNKAGEVVHKIEDSFEVRDYIPFDIERTAPTRIYPPSPYGVTLNIHAHRDFTGDINERVPRGFILSDIDGANISTLPEYTLITWSDVTMKEGDSLQLSYTFDAPDITPYLFLLGPLDMDGFKELRQWQIASDALTAVAWLTGTQTAVGTNLNNTASPLLWSTSTVDAYYFTHSTSTDVERLTLKRAGDYFMSVTLPQNRTDGNARRTRIGLEVRVNGVAIPQGLGQSGYIENQGSQSESSSHVNVLLTDMNPNDYIEVYAQGLTTYNAADIVNVTGQAGMYVEFISSTNNVFAATTTKTTNSVNLNQATAYPLEWTETRQDNGFSHSNVVNPQNITISNAGTYLVQISVPLNSPSGVTATNPLGRVLLNGVQVSGGIFAQGYLAGETNTSDADASMHWSGVVVSTTSNAVLTITTETEATAGTTTVPAGFVGSIYIQAAPAAETIILRGRDLIGGTDWSNSPAEEILWDTRIAYDATVFTHSTTTNNSQITINTAGDYLLTYNDALTGTTQRTNNRITVTVNGVKVSGAETKSHFMRNAGGHNNSSGALTFLLTGVTTGQIVRVFSEQEAGNATMNDTTDAVLMITKKADLNFEPAAPATFNQPFDNIRFASTTPYFDFQGNDPDGSSDIVYQFAISTTSDFSVEQLFSSASTSGFINTATATDTSPFFENQKIRFQLATSSALADLTTYYWRVRAADISGSNNFGDWTTTQSLTVDLSNANANWYQTFAPQFNTNTLVGAVTGGNDSVKVDAALNTEMLLAYGESTVTTPRYRLWDGTSWGTEANAIAVGGTINWVDTAAGVSRDEYAMVTLDQSNKAYAQIYSASSSSWGNQTLLADSISSVTTRGIAVGYESNSGDALAVSCGIGRNFSYRTWNGVSWSATTTVALSSTNNCNFMKITSDPASDEMILVVRDTGLQYEALVWDGNTWGNSKVLGSASAGLREGIAINYESSGDQAVIVVSNGTANNVLYTTWDGTGWSANSTQTTTNDFIYGNLTADPNSDKLTLCYIDASARVGVLRWDGGVWAAAFTNIENTANSATARPVDCLFETAAGRTGNILAMYSDTTDARYQVFATSTWTTEATITGLSDSFWLNAKRAEDGTIVLVNLDDVTDNLESSFWNGTSWSSKQTIENSPSSVIAAPYEMYDLSPKRFSYNAGTVRTSAINFSNVPNQPTWGDLSFNTTEPFGTDVKVRVKYTATTTCDSYVPNGALTGNDTGFDVSASPINLTGLSTSTYSQLCLEAAITNLGSVSATLNDWTLAWVREPKLIQTNYRWYVNGNFITPTDPWPLGVSDLIENGALTADVAINNGASVRLRMSIQGANVIQATSSKAFKLQYAEGFSCSPSLSWRDVGGIGSTTALWRGYSNIVESSDWYGSSWLKRVKITVNSALATGTDLTNFPVYVNLDDLPDTFFDAVQSDGDDIRITTSDGVTEVPIELVSIDTGADVGELYFKAPTISTTTDTVFYIYYANASASGYGVTDTYGRNNVWTNNYAAVWHMNNVGSTVVDSTGKGSTGTKGPTTAAPTQVTSPRGVAQSCDGNDYIEFGDVLDPNNADWTISTWFKQSVAGTAQANILYNKENMYEAAAGGGNHQYAWQPSWAWYGGGAFSTASGTWAYGVVTYNKVQQIMYKDGTSVYSRAQAGNMGNNTEQLQFCARGNLGHSSFFNGQLDEVRMASTSRSAGWIKTEFNNQSNPTGFYVVQAEEQVDDGRLLPTTLLSDSDFPETYEANNPTALNRFSIPVGNDNEWDWSLENNGATSSTNYCFRMAYQDGSSLNSYLNYPRLVTNGPPLPPSLSAPFANEQLASTTPWFEFSANDELSDLVSYEIVVDDNADFSSPVMTRDSVSTFSLFTNLVNNSERSQYTSGQTIRFVPTTALTNGVTYYWRVRAKDDFGSGIYGDWSTPFSLTVNTATAITTWFQTTSDQLTTNSLEDALANAGTNDIGIDSGFSSATTTSTVIDYDNRDTGNAWGTFSFNQNVTSGTITYRIEYRVSGETFALIPDTSLPGNSSGFTSSPVNISSLDTTIYNEIRLQAVFTGNATLPRLLDWQITWSQTIDVPTTLQPFDNAKVSTTTPSLTFFTTDPQSDDLQYQVQISSSYAFTSSSTFLSGVDAGFVNTINGGDTSDFISGNTIKYSVQTPLSNGQTYWWRTRARDPGDSNTFSKFSSPKSFTVDTGTTVSTWFQTVGDQFSTDDLVDIETTPTTAKITSAIKGVMIAYGEGTGQSPRYNIWNGSVLSATGTAGSVGAQIRWLDTEAAPTRPEYALASQGTDLDVNIQIYNSETEIWGNTNQIQTDIGVVNQRGFDIAYETTSGKLLAVACDGLDAVYSVWNGTSWTATSSLNLANANACRTVTMDSDPNSNEIIAIFEHTNTGNPDYEVQVWNGSSWGSSITLGNITTNGNTGAAVTYEESGNEAMVVVSNGTAASILFSTWNGLSWSSTTETQTIGNDFTWGSLKRDVGTDRIALCYIDTDSDIGVLEWDGSAWNTFNELELLGNSSAGQPVDCEYETVGGRDGYLMVPYSDDGAAGAGAGGSYQFNDGLGWSGKLDLGSLEDSWRVSTVRAKDGIIHAVFFDDIADRYNYVQWDGSDWVVQASIPTPSITGTPFDGSLAMAAQIFPNFTSGSIQSTPINFADGVGPRWERVTFTDSKPGASVISYQVYYQTIAGMYELIPDSALPGNAAGFTISPINLSALDTAVYSVLKIDAQLSCVSGNCPTLNEWSVEWSEGITVSGNALAYDGVTPVASGTVAVAVNGVLQVGKTAQISGGGTTTNTQVFSSAGTSTFTVPAGVSQVTVKTWGAGGGGGSGGSVDAGGSGAGAGFAQGTLSVTPGENLLVSVGGGGGAAGAAGSAGAGGGGGGGGYSALYRSSTPLLIAGAGGGGGGGARGNPISYTGVGNACAVSGAGCTPTIPTGVQDDVYILVLHSRTNTAHTCTTNCTGWTEFSTQAGDGTGGRVSTWYLRRGGSAPANPTFGGPATESYTGRIWGFRGVIETGNPYGPVGVNTTQAASTTYTGSSLVSTKPDAMSIFVGGSMDNNTWGPGSGSCNTPNGINASFYSANTAGTDNSVFLCYNDNPLNTPGTIAAPVMTQAAFSPDPGRWFNFLLQPSQTPITAGGQGGVGGGLSGGAGGTASTSIGGGGGTQTVGGNASGAATIGGALAGGAGGAGTGGATGGSAGILGGGVGGTGVGTSTALAAGGGGAAGYFGGGGGSQSSASNVSGAGGGGGSSFITTSATATSTLSGSTTQPGNTGDLNYGGSAGVGGAGGASTTAGAAGAPGRVVFTWTATSTNGSWTISNVPVVAGDVVTVFVDGATTSSKAVGITKYDGTGNIANMSLIQRHVTIGSDDAPTISNSDLGLYDSVDDSDLFQLVTGGNIFNLCGVSGCSDAVLRVQLGATYAPAGNSTVINFKNNGTFAPASTTLRISGQWDQSGTFTPDTSTVIFTATTSSSTLLNASTSLIFNNVTFGETSGSATWNITKPLLLSGSLNVNFGTLARGTSTITLSGNLALGASGIVTGLASTTFAGTGSNTWGDSKASSTNMGYVVIDGTAKTITQSGNVGAETVTIGADDTLNSSGSGFTINVVKNWTNNNSFIPQTGTVNFMGTTSGTIARGTSAFNHLSFTGVGGMWAFSTSTLVLNGTLTIATGTVTLPTGTTTIGGSFINSGGTFLHNNGEVRMTSTSGGRTITTLGTTFLNTFYDLTFTGSGAWTFTGAATSSRHLRISAGTVTLPASTLAVAGDFVVTGSGNFSHNNGEVQFGVNSANYISPNNSSFNDVRIMGGSGAWYNANWQSRQQITVKKEKVPANQTNFPVYVNLANLGATFFSQVNASGTDIRVTTSDGMTEIPFEVVSVSTSTSAGELYFKATSLSSTTDSSFYIYYGNVGAAAYASSSTYGSQNVWNNGYVGVWHMNNSGATILDSTAGNYTGTKGGGAAAPTQVTSPLGVAQSCDGGDYIDFGNVLNPGASSWTVTTWHKPTAVGTAQAGILYNKENMYEVSAGGNDSQYAFMPSWNWYAAGAFTTAVGNWYAGATVYNKSSQVFYKNGTSVYSRAHSGDMGTNATRLQFCARGDTAHTSLFTGEIDEFRISNVARSPEWLATEYNNQSTTTDFYTTSAVEPQFRRIFTAATTNILGNYVAEPGGNVQFASGVLAIGGSFNNRALFDANAGTVRFNSSAGTETVVTGSSTFATLEFNNAGANYTVTENATATVAINLTNVAAFTLASGTTLTTTGTFTNAANGANTTWTGSTLSLSGPDGALNAKAHAGDIYGTLDVQGDTDITMWNSSAVTYNTASTSSIYSADHAGVDGDLNVYGDYVRTTGTEYWSYTTDFDGAALTGSTSRQVDVRVATSSKIGFVSASLNMVGSALASSTIDALSGTYALNATNTTITASNFTVAGTNASGLQLNASTTLSVFQDGFFTVVPGRTGITISSSTVTHNPAAQYQRIGFATTTAGAGTNVTLNGTSSSFVWFRLGTGNLYGEDFDANDANPGSIRFDDSSNSITISGVVYADDGVTPLGAPTCNGTTPNVRVVINNGSYTASTTCNAVTGAYTLNAVNYIGDPKITVYLNTNGGVDGTVVSKTPSGNITNMNIYAGRVITRHQDVAPLTIADMTSYDFNSDSDIKFMATTTGSTTLTVLAPNSLYVFATSTFAPGGNVTLLGNASSSAVEGTLQLGAAATFTASGTETHTLAGRLVLATTSTLTAASSTFVFNATTTGKSITSPNTITFNTLQFTGVNGGWNITAPLIVNGNMDVATGTVTGTSNVTLVSGSLSGDGTLSFGAGTTTLNGTNTFGGTRAWTFSNLVLGNGLVVGTTTRAATATTTIAGRLTISAAHFLVAGTSNWDLSGTGSVLVESGTLQEDTSTFRYSGASSQVLSTTYYNLDINAGAGTPTYTAVGVGIGVTNNLTVGGTAATTFDVNASDPALVVGGSVNVRSNGTFSASNIATTSVGGSWTNTGTFTSNGGLVAMVGSGVNTIAAGNSSFGTLLINNVSGAFTVSQNATTTVALNLLNQANFTVAPGVTMAIGGTFTNTLGGAATTFSSSTLSFYGGGTKSINAKTVSDVYDTVAVAAGTNVKMWNSSAVNYSAQGGIYSQDHAGVDGKLNIYGAYTQTTGNDYWSTDTDFDGTALGVGARPAAVAFASGASAVYSGGGLEVLGSTTASTTLDNQGAGTYGLTISGTATTNWDRVVLRNMNAAGVVFLGTPAVSNFSNTDHLVSINGGTGLTVSGTVIDANQAKNFTNNVFASSSGVTGATNVTATGTSVSSWRFTNHSGALSGEAYDADPAGDPGYIVWDNSAALITVSGNVYSDEGVTVSTVCDGSTQNITLRVAGLTSTSTSCAAGTGAYSIANVAFSPADNLTVYIDGNARKAVTVSTDPVSSISNMHLYENRVIVRHENTTPLSIAKMAVWDSSDDADLLFTAVDAGTDTLTLAADQKLLIWSGKTFAPNGNVTVAGGGAGGAADGTLEAQTNATFKAQGAEVHTIGGSMIFGTGATFTAGQSTTTFTTTGAARTIDVNDNPFYNVAFTGSGSWNVTDTIFTTNKSLTQTAGSIAFGSGTTTVGASFNATAGAFTMSGSALVFTSTSTGNVVRFDDSVVPRMLFMGTGGTWSMTDTNATTTGSFTIASGTVTLPTGNLGVGGNFENLAGTIVHNTADIIMSATSSASVRASSSSLFALRFIGAGPFTMTDVNLTLADSLTMSTGTLTLATGTLAVAGDFTIASGTVNNASGTVLFNATSVGKTVNWGNNALYNVVFGSATGGWTFNGNATTTNHFSITGASSFTKAINTTLAVGGVFTNTVGGANTTWATTTLRLNGVNGYTINTKTTGGDVYGTLEIASPLAIRAWNSSAATTTVLGTASLYSQDHAAVDGALNIYGNLAIATTTEYWNYSHDFDGTVLAGASQRQVNVKLAANATTTLSSGALQLVGTAATSTTVSALSGAYAFIVSGGTLNAQYYSLTNLNADGWLISGAPTISNLANGSLTLTAAGGSLLTVDATVLDANASKVFTGVNFATTTAITGFNVTLTGSTSNAWRFSGSTGNLSGEAFDVDGLTACGSIRFDNSGCLLTQQTHYRWRNDDGGEGVANSEWFDLGFNYRQRVRIVNTDTSSYASTAVKVAVTYDSSMQSDFDDLRFTSSDGLTTIPYWIERYTASTDATVWVRVPNLPASETATVFMYYGSSTVSSNSAGATTFDAFDDFEDNNITEYSGDTSLFQTDTAPVYGGTYALEASNKSGRTTDGIFRTAMTVSQGQVIRWMQYLNTTAGAGDEACTLFGVQSPGVNNNNYAVCLEQFGIDRVSISKNVSDNDVSGTVLASTTATFATGWYEVEVDWRTNNSITAYVRTAAGSLVATASTTDATYTTGGTGFTFWFQNGSWDSYTARARAILTPAVYFGAEQTAGGATWEKPQNVPGSGVTGAVKRLRFAIENSGLDITGQTFRLEYADKGAAPSCEAVASGNFAAVPNQAACGSSPVCMQTSSQVADNDASTDHLASTSGAFSAGRVIESPSNITSALNVNQNNYTELEYVLTPTINATSSYCLRVSNGGVPLDFYNKIAELNLQFDPVFGAISLNYGNPIALTPGTTTSIYATGTVTDFNGYADLVAGSSTIYRSGAGALCADDSNNCYRGDTTASSSCSFINCAGNTCTLSCRADIYFNAEATDVVPYEGEEWLAYLEVRDAGGGYDFASALGVELLTLRAAAVNNAINYGSLAVADNTGGFNPTTTVSNVGNTAFNLELLGTDLSDGGSSKIPANQQKYATSTFTYSACVSCGVISSTTPTTLALGLTKPVVPTPPITADVYWGIAVPVGVNSAPHSGINVFTPVSP